MNIRFALYVYVVAAAAMGLLASMPWPELAHVDIYGVLSFIALGVLTEVTAIDFTIDSGKTARSSIAFLPLLAAAIAFPPVAAVTIAGAIHIVTELVLRDRAFLKTTFNISQGVLSAGSAALVYRWSSGSFIAVQPIAFIPFMALAITFFFSNIFLVSVALTVRQKQSFLLTVKTIVGPAGGNILYDLLASPVAIVAVVLYREFPHFGLIIIVLPLLLIRASYHTNLKLLKANRDLLSVLIKAIETRDPYTSGHSVRVSTLARLIAQDMRLSSRRIEKIETAALLHDVGKIDVLYATIICKPVELSDRERDIIRTHAAKGADLLRGLSSFDSEVIEGVRHHHERYDGNGYPDRLKGTQIPLAARIITLCDAIDAMLSDRPYRPAMSIQSVYGELRRCAGTQFDPNIVGVIIERGTLQRAADLIMKTKSDKETAYQDTVVETKSRELVGNGET